MLKDHRLIRHGLGKKCALCGFTHQSEQVMRRHIRNQCRYSSVRSDTEIDDLIQEEYDERDERRVGESQQDEEGIGVEQEKGGSADGDADEIYDGTCAYANRLLASRRMLQGSQLFYRQ